MERSRGNRRVRVDSWASMKEGWDDGRKMMSSREVVVVGCDRIRIKLVLG